MRIISNDVWKVIFSKKQEGKSIEELQKEYGFGYSTYFMKKRIIQGGSNESLDFKKVVIKNEETKYDDFINVSYKGMEVKITKSTNMELLKMLMVNLNDF